jgi:hypothetical protein
VISRCPIRLVRVTTQSRKQLNIVSNLPADESASALIAACEISCQSADRTTPPWIISMGFAQVIIDQGLVGHARLASDGCIDPIFPHFQRGADRFGNQCVTRFEVLIEAAHGKASFLGEDNHDIRIHFIGRPGEGRALRKAKGCYRRRCVERHRPRDGEEAHRKWLSRGCELPEHYGRYDAPQHTNAIYFCQIRQFVFHLSSFDY